MILLILKIRKQLFAKIIKSNFFNSVTNKHLMKAEIITNTSYLSLNLILIILLFFILRTTLKKIILLKYRLIILCIIKAIMRIIYIKYYFFEKKLMKEILLSIFNTFQIYLIIMLFESILVDIDSINNNQNNQNGENEKYNKKINQYFSIVLLIINLPYERFSSFKTFINLLQNICLLVYSLLFYQYINKKINLIIIKLIDGNLLNESDIYIRLLDVRIPILILFLLIFIIDIFVRLSGNSTLVLYSKLINLTLRESSNILIFIIFYSLIYLLEKKNQKKIALSYSSTITETKKLMNEQ